MSIGSKKLAKCNVNYTMNWRDRAKACVLAAGHRSMDDLITRVFYYSPEFSIFHLYSTGSVIRCFRRLEELMREMCHAARAIGNTELENKFADGMYEM